MPSATAFIMEDTEVHDNSGESIMDESDLEDLDDAGTVASEANHASRYFWLGKRVFTQLLAHVVFEENPSMVSGDELDSAMMMKLATYPYEERSRQLSDLGYPATAFANQPASPHAFRRFTIQLGSVHCRGGDETNAIVSALIQRGSPDMRDQGRTRASSPIPLQEAPHSTIPGLHVDLNGPQEEEDDDDDANLPRYTTALKEYGDKRGISISWPTRQISITPLAFRCTTSVRADSFEGTAGNKKKAKHLASRQACRVLEIRI